MAREKFPVEPQITVNDTVVKVGPLSWGGIKAVRDRIKSSGLELPKIEFGAGEKSLSLLTLDDLGEFAQRNLSILAAWLASCPELVDVLILDGSNVPADVINEMSAADVFAVGRAIVDASVATGLFGNGALFFAGLLAPLFAAPAKQSEAPPSETSIPAGESKTSTG